MTSSWQAFARAVTGEQSADLISQPTGLALSVDETRLYVACAAVAKLYEFDFANKTVRQIADKGDAGLQFPYTVAVDAADNIYVTDSTLKKVVVINRDGDKLRELGGDDMFVRPTGIAIDRKRDLVYVADGASKKSTHHAVEVFRSNGEHLRTIGVQGGKEGEFYYPTYLAVAADGRLHVADTMNFRVQVFDAEGAYVNQFGKQGKGYGSFGRIKGMAFDAFGNLHVVDSDFALVQIFNPDLQPLMWYGGRANKLEFFDMPTAVAVDSRNHIYVANFYYGRVNEYEYINTSQDDVYSAPGSGADREDAAGGDAARGNEPDERATPTADESHG